MSTTPATVPTSVFSTLDSARTAVVAGSVLGVLGALTALGWALSNPDDPAREIVTGPGQVIGCFAAAIGCTILLLALPRVLRGLSPWAVGTTVAAIAFVLVDAWYAGTTAVAVANGVDEAAYDSIYESGWVFAFYLPKMLLGLLGFSGLAMSGKRTSLVSTPLCVLLVVAGLASLVPPFMPGMIVGGVALALVARSKSD
jgi:hypothetical protein